MPAHTPGGFQNGLNQIQTDTSAFKRIQTDSNGFRIRHSGGGFSTNPPMHRRIQTESTPRRTDSHGFKRIQTDSDGFRRIQVDSHGFTRIQKRINGTKHANTHTHTHTHTNNKTNKHHGTKTIVKEHIANKSAATKQQRKTFQAASLSGLATTTGLLSSNHYRDNEGERSAVLATFLSVGQLYAGIRCDLTR